MALPRSHLETFTGWLASFGDAWERRDPDALAALFVIEATFQASPFAALLRGRRAIRDHWATELAGLDDVQFRAQVLGVGDTYGVAHWRASYRRNEDESRAVIVDGVLLAALDPRGRCTSLRQWWHTQEHPVVS
jgi:hypothetical protein